MPTRSLIGFAPWLAACLAASVLGCGAPPPSAAPDALPKAVASVEAHAYESLEALGRRDAADALEPLSELRQQVARLADLGPAAGLDVAASARLSASAEKLAEVLQRIDGALGGGSLPDGFDLRAVRSAVESALSGVRDALPAGVLAEVQRLAAARPKPALPRPTVTQPPSGALYDVDDTPPTERDDPTLDGPTLNDPTLDAGDPIAVPAGVEPAGATSPERPQRSLPAPVTDATSSRPAPAAPLYPSVLMFDRESWRLTAERVARCGEIVAGFPPDARWVQLFPTVHAIVRDDQTIARYGRMIDRGESWGDPDNFLPATDDEDPAEVVRVRCGEAIRMAVARGLHLAVTPHLDPAGTPDEAWRNTYRFAPDEVIDGHSYRSLLLEPIAEALVAELTPDTRVDFALSGEMGRSLLENADEWLRTLVELRERFAAEPHCAGVRLGVALNWGYIGGGADDAAVDAAAVARLIAECDFVGYSCYAPVSVPPTPEDFARATRNFLAELADWGADLPPDTRLLMTELGIGGGVPKRASDNRSQAAEPGGSPALVWPTLQEIAAKPYEGRGDGRFDPWADPQRRELRRQYHATLRSYLTATPPTGERRVERAFLWSEGPWDPQGVADRRFADPAITN